MFDYLDWRGDLSFESDPLNAIDLLILATLSYCPMERLHGVFISSTPIQLTAELYPPDAAFRNDSEKQRCQLWKAASESERFGKMQVQAIISTLPKKSSFPPCFSSWTKTRLRRLSAARILLSWAGKRTSTWASNRPCPPRPMRWSF